jgi:AbiU2
MKDIFPLQPVQQVERFRALFNYLDLQYRQLVVVYKLLVPPWSEQALIDHFTQTSSQQAFQLVRSALLDSCILIIYKLLTDGEGTNPSLRTMVRPFLHGNREKCSELLEILEHDYSDGHTYVSQQESETAPDWVIKALEERDKEHVKACREKFWERADLIASDWPKLEQASHTINRVRSRCTAHLEVEYDSTIKEYRPVDQTSLLEVYQTVQKVVPIVLRLSEAWLAQSCEGMSTAMPVEVSRTQ